MLPLPSLRHVGWFLFSLLLLALPASATWSILIIDLATGEVAVGIATCLTGFDLRPNTVVVVPGYGVAAAQSFVGPLNLRELIRTGLLSGTSAQQILAQLAAADGGHQSRQYGIASLAGGAVTFTGTGAGAWAGGLTGQTGTLVYTVQGNVLTGAAVNLAAEQAILNTPGSIGDKLMAAMEAARAMGGDGRCSCSQGAPTACGAPPPSFTKSAHIGLMIWSRPSDVDAPCSGTLGCGAGQYWMDLNVANQNASDPDPVLTLRQRYDQWKLLQIGRPDHYRSTVVLDRTRIRANGQDAITGTVTLRDANGTPLGNSLPLSLGIGLRSTARQLLFSPAVPQPDGTYRFTVRAELQAGAAILDVAAVDAFGRIGIAPQPVVTIDDAFGACGTGAIPGGAGGFLDALKIDGRTGPNRTVQVGYAQPFVISLDAPTGAPTTPPIGAYALWLHLGLPVAAPPLPLPPFGGALCFLPAPFAPSAPTLLAADSLGAGGYIATGPAPVQIGIPGVAAVLDTTLQAAMVIDAQGTIAATNAVLLRVVPLPAPVVTAVWPPAPRAGTPVTVTGSQFAFGIELEVQGQPTPLSTWSPTSLSFAMPNGLPCDAVLRLRNPGGQPVQATFNATPVITNMPYTSGPAAGGALFILGGQHLAGATVTFNGQPMNITSQGATVIVGTTPPGTPGPATVEVRNANGCLVQRPYTYL